jgi:hypothetical protein
MSKDLLKKIYPVLESMTRTLCVKHEIHQSKVPIIIQNTLVQFDLKTLNNTEKQDLITDFKRLVREEIKQMQTQN